MPGRKPSRPVKSAVGKLAVQEAVSLICWATIGILGVSIRAILAVSSPKRAPLTVLGGVVALWVDITCSVRMYVWMNTPIRWVQVTYSLTMASEVGPVLENKS